MKEEKKMKEMKEINKNEYEKIIILKNNIIKRNFENYHRYDLKIINKDKIIDKKEYEEKKKLEFYSMMKMKNQKKKRLLSKKDELLREINSISLSILKLDDLLKDLKIELKDFQYKIKEREIEKEIERRLEVQKYAKWELRDIEIELSKYL